MDTKLIRYLAIVMLIGFLSIVFFYSLLIPQGHDWDLDSFLYLGSRLSSGELLYEYDFETKLPLLQYIFWFPAFFGGIGAWRIFNFLICFILTVSSVWLIFHSIIRVKHSKPISPKIIWPVWFIPLITMLVLYSLPGSSSAHISMVSGCLVFFAIGAIHRGLTNSKYYFLWTVMAGVALSAAVSIRPNFLYTLPGLVLIYVLWWYIVREPISFKKHISMMLIFIFSFILGSLLQFIPYLFIKDGLVTVYSGLIALANFSIGSSPRAVISSQILNSSTFSFYLMLFAMFNFLLFILLRINNDELKLLKKIFAGLLGTGLALIGLEYQAISRHYYSHYGMMFVPFFGVFLTYYFLIYVAYKKQLFSLKPIKGKLLKSLNALILLAVILAFVSQAGLVINNNVFSKGYDLFVNRGQLSLNINERGIDKNLLTFLENAQNNGFSFYVPINTNYHRLLEEIRIGDGHPVMLYNVLTGNRVGPVGSIFLYSDEVYKAPCKAINESGKDLIIISRTEGSGYFNIDFLVEDCLERTGGSYNNFYQSQESKLFVDDELYVIEQNYIIYIRK
jgi:hypothetical protein